MKEISAKEAIKESSAVFLDTRERREFEESHIKNAIWSGYDDFNMNRLKGIPKNQKIILYCSIGLLIATKLIPFISKLAIIVSITGVKSFSFPLFLHEENEKSIKIRIRLMFIIMAF